MVRLILTRLTKLATKMLLTKLVCNEIGSHRKTIKPPKQFFLFNKF